MTDEMQRIIDKRRKVQKALIHLYRQGEIRKLFRWRDEQGTEHLELRYRPRRK